MSERFNFTKKKIDLIPSPAKGRRLIYDETVSGLALQITSAGTRTFQVYKKINKRPIRVTLGKYPEMPIEQARRKALATIAKLNDGFNPNEEKKAEKSRGITLDEALQGYFDSRPALKESTRKNMRVTIEAVYPDWIGKPIASIDRDMVEKRHREYGKRANARANLAGRYLRAVFNFAIDRYPDTGINENPVAVLKRSWYRVDRRRGVIKPHELRSWWDAVEGLENRCASDYFKVLLLTGLRREEARNLKWNDVDLKGRTLIVRDPKNRCDHVLPLSGYLTRLFERRLKEAADDFVFATERGQFANLRYPLREVRTKSNVEFTCHDLRRTFTTIGDALDLPAYALKGLLNHKNGSDITASYIVINPERLRGPMEKISEYVLKTVGELESAAVIDLKFGQG